MPQGMALTLANLREDSAPSGKEPMAPRPRPLAWVGLVVTSRAFSAGHSEKALGLSLLKEGMQLIVWISYHFKKLVFSEPRVKFLHSF